MTHEPHVKATIPTDIRPTGKQVNKLQEFMDLLVKVHSETRPVGAVPLSVYHLTDNRIFIADLVHRDNEKLANFTLCLDNVEDDMAGDQLLKDSFEAARYMAARAAKGEGKAMLLPYANPRKKELGIVAGIQGDGKTETTTVSLSLEIGCVHVENDSYVDDDEPDLGDSDWAKHNAFEAEMLHAVHGDLSPLAYIMRMKGGDNFKWGIVRGEDGNDLLVASDSKRTVALTTADNWQRDLPEVPERRKPENLGPHPRNPRVDRYAPFPNPALNGGGIEKNPVKKKGPITTHKNGMVTDGDGNILSAPDDARAPFTLKKNGNVTDSTDRTVLSACKTRGPFEINDRGDIVDRFGTIMISGRR